MFAGAPGSVAPVAVGSAAAPGGTISMAAGSTIEVNGGLLQNNGTIGASGAGLVNINYGGLAKGLGAYAGGYSVNDGGRFQPGNSPGTVTTGSAVGNPGGSFTFQVNDAAGVVGVNTSRNVVNGMLTVNATPTSQFGISVQSLTSGNAPGAVPNFDPSQPYHWTIVQTTGGITGFSPPAVALDASGFSNPLAGGSFSLSQSSGNLVLSFTPVPEPAVVLALCAAAAGGLAQWRRCRRNAGRPGAGRARRWRRAAAGPATASTRATGRVLRRAP